MKHLLKWRPSGAQLLVTWMVFVALIYFWWVWRIYHPEELSQRLRLFFENPSKVAAQQSESVRNWGLLAVGVIGLPMAIWRAITADLQTKEAITQGRRVQQQMRFTERQIEITERQIQISEENNLAVLLEKSASFLPETTEPKVATAIALLHHISGKSTFALEATDMLSNYVAGKVMRFYEPRNLMLALDYLESIGKNRGKAVTARATVEGNDEAVFYAWFTRVTYNNCEFYKQDLRGHQLRINSFVSCDFTDCVVDKSVRISGTSTLRDCKVTALRVLRTPGEMKAEFTNCDFSGCEYFSGNGHVLTDCYYTKNNPPVPAILKKYGGELTPRGTP
jgi:hypothetical protein